MPDTENSGRSSCPPVAYKRSIRKKRQIARERTLWETNDRDVLLAEADGCRKLNAAAKDNQEVEFGLAFTENQLIRGYLQFFGERPDRIDLLIGEQGNCFFRTKRVRRAIGIPHNQNIFPGCVSCHRSSSWGTWLKCRPAIRSRSLSFRGSPQGAWSQRTPNSRDRRSVG